jgi:hypothetical protein
MNPFLAPKSLFNRLGPYTTRVIPGISATEEDYNQRAKDRGVVVVGRGVGRGIHNWRDHEQIFRHVGVVPAQTEKWAEAKAARERAQAVATKEVT